MPNTIPIQTSFSGGELSPKLRGRVDSELYKKALAHCENWEPLAHGPLLTKRGSRFNRLFDDIDDRARIFAFPRQGDTGFLLVMGGGKLRVRDGISGDAIMAGAIEWIRNPRFRDGWLNWWRDLSSGGFFPLGQTFVNNDRYFICSPWNMGIGGPTPYPRIQQTITVPAGTYKVRLRGSTAAGQVLRLRLGSAPNGQDIADMAVSGAGLSDYKTDEHTLPPFGASTTIYVDVVTLNYNRAELIPGVGLAGAQVVEVSVTAESSTEAVWDSGTTPAMPWTDNQLERIQMVAEPARDRVMLFHPEVRPYELVYDDVAKTWAFGQIAFSLPVPAPWGLIDGEYVYPGAAELYQGRLFVGGIKGKENTFLASKSGLPYDFTEAAAASAADPFSLDVSTKGAIRWMQGHRTLLLGTDRGELIATAQGGVLTPSDFEVRAQSGFGSAPVQALTLGERVLYVSRDRRRLRMLSYNQQENGWQTRDLTFTAEHLTGGLIREVHWLSTGNDQVLAVMRDGTVRAWSYNLPENVVAPWRVNFGSQVYSMAILDMGENDRVWMLVQRVGGVALEEWVVADDGSACALDSWVSVTPAAGEVSGLAHLEDLSVVPIVDGVIGVAQTVSDGKITVDAAATTCVVGLYNAPSFTTLPKEGTQPAGTAQGSRQRAVKLSLRLNDSALPLVNGDRAGADRHPSTLMDTVEGRVTEDVTVRVLGWEDGAAVTITQDKPIRTEILAIYGVVAAREV